MDAVTRDRKLARLQDAHMQPLTAYRDELSSRTGKVIPHFDPEDGGARAELLLLLSHVDGDPGSARNGSGFISMENEDQTARNLRKVVVQLGLPRETLLVWNVVPWQDGHATKEASQGARHLPRLVQGLPELRGIALLSKDGRQVKAVQAEFAHGRRVEWMVTFNPGPQSYNNHGAQLALDLQNIARKLSLI